MAGGRANAAGGSVPVAEVLRQRAVRERARWEEFNRRAREEEEEEEEEEERSARGRAGRPLAVATMATTILEQPGRGTTRSTRRRRRRRARERTDEQRDDDDDDDEPMCRICFGGEEEGAKGADRLFAPCQCRGSQGLVHVLSSSEPVARAVAEQRVVLRVQHVPLQVPPGARRGRGAWRTRAS